MNFTLDHFKANKRELHKHLTQLSFVLADLKQGEEIKQVESIRQQLEHEQFQIVVVGEFSRGKSTFINALLGKKLLPSSAKPTTTILNMITHHPKSTITLYYHHEGTPPRVISEDEFKTVVAPKEPIVGDTYSEQEYEKKVEYLQSIQFAEIAHPLSFCEEGAIIIDTPGTNDLDAAREQITNTFIPNADAAILLLSAVKILSESEMSFLRDRIMASDIQKIFVVVNFKDDLRTLEDQEKVLTDAATKLQPILGDVKLYLVSSKEALNAKRKANGEELVNRRGPIPVWEIERTGFIELESALADFLQYERGAVKLKKPIIKVHKMIDQVIEKKIGFERRALTTSIEGLQEKVADFKRKLHAIRLTGKEAVQQLDIELAKESQGLENWYSTELRHISSVGMDTFDTYRYQVDKDELPGKVETAIAPLERDLHMEKTQKIEKALENAVNRASKTLNDEWGKLDRQFQHAFSEPTSNELSLHVYTGGTTEGTSGIIFFEDLLDELSGAWGSSTTLTGKVLSGAGIALTVVAYGVFEIGRSILSWMFGSGDQTAKLRAEVSKRLQSSKQNKQTAFQKEWRDISKGLKKQFAENIEKQITNREQQLVTLTDNAQLEENQILEKMNQLDGFERKLKAIQQSLHSIESSLTLKKGEVISR